MIYRCRNGFGTPWNGLGNSSCTLEEAIDPFSDLPLRSTRRLEAVRDAFDNAGLDQSMFARFLDNPDFQRILAINPSLSVLR